MYISVVHNVALSRSRILQSETNCSRPLSDLCAQQEYIHTIIPELQAFQARFNANANFSFCVTVHACV